MSILELLRSDPNLCPAFAAALPDPARVRLDAYKLALRRFDFFFEAADDGRYLLTQKAVLRVLRDEQQAIDPTGEIWMAIRAERCVCSGAGPEAALPKVVRHVMKTR